MGRLKAAVLLLSLAIPAGVPAAVWAQTVGGSTTGQARASVIRPIAISQTTALDFGILTPVSTSVTVTLTPGGEISASNPSSIIASPHSAGAFAVSGQANRVYTVSVPSSFDLTAGGQTVSVSAVQYQFNGAGAVGGTGQFDGSGQQTFDVGGTLTIAADQAAGDYSGTYAVTVAYQ